MKIISRILLVVGDALEREAAHVALSRCGAEILSTESARGAHHLLQLTEPPDLVILHLDFQDPNPLQLYQQMRQAPSTRTIPLLMLVDSPLERTMVDNLKLTHCACFLAPLTFGALVFVLPSLGLEITDGILCHKETPTPAMPFQERREPSPTESRA
ncbi:MAG: hypothetical protein ABIR24_01825 [Verrucomicrobiota bacterium]